MDSVSELQDRRTFSSLQYAKSHLAGICHSLCSSVEGVTEAAPQISKSDRKVSISLQDHARMYGGLLVLRVLTRKYEFRDDVSVSCDQGYKQSADSIVPCIAYSAVKSAEICATTATAVQSATVCGWHTIVAHRLEL